MLYRVVRNIPKGAANYPEFTISHMLLVIASRYMTINSSLCGDWSGGTSCAMYGTVGMGATCDTHQSILPRKIFFKASTNNRSVRPHSFRMKLWTVQHAITKYRIENGGIHFKTLKHFLRIPNVLSTTEHREECL